MLASIHSGSSTKVWPEILRASERHRCQVFAFPGGRLNSSDEFEYMRNRIFGLVKAKSFDGVVCWASSLSGFVSESQVEDFLLRQLDLPLVTFGLKIGDKPVVNIDAYDGMRRLVLHLVRRHGRRRIAYIGGPRAHSSAEDRFTAYRDALAEAGIGYDPRIVHLDTPWHEGAKAMLELLDKEGLIPGKDFDAVCAASDLLVFEAAKILKERDVKIPAELSLGGFNDSDESDLLSPTFTTVRMPFRRQADQAFRMLIEVLDGRRPSDRTLKTSLVVRQSCGCVPGSVVLAKGATKALQGKAVCGNAEIEEMTAWIIRKIARRLGFSSTKELDHLAALIGGFAEAMDGRHEEAFLNSLDEALDEAITGGKNLDAFQDLLSILRSIHEADAVGPKDRERLETLVHQGRVLVSGAERRMSNLRIWQERTQDKWIAVLNHELLRAKDLNSVLDAAARCLPRLGIRSGYLVMDEAEADGHYFIGRFYTPAAGDAAKVQKPTPDKLSFPSDQLLPATWRPSGPGAFVVLPLYDESMSFGYAVLEAGEAGASLFEEVRAQLSSALRGVLLFEQVDLARHRAERAERLKTEFLAGISGELQAPMRFIDETARLLLSDPKLIHREELEAISARSEYQLRLTRRLFDLSLAQVGDLPMDFSLLDPTSFVRDFATLPEAKGERSRWGKPEVELPATELPLLQGDRNRLLQILEIFADILSRELGMTRLCLRLEAGAGGLSILLGGAARKKDGSGRLRKMLETPASASSSDEAKIEIELARRMALLHGGFIALREEELQGPTLALLLPYPSMDGSMSAERREKPASIPANLGDTFPPALAALFPESSGMRLRIGGPEASRLVPEDIAFIYADFRRLEPEGWAAFNWLIAQTAWRKLPCFVPSACLDLASDSIQNLSELAKRLEPAKAMDSAFFLGAPEDLGGELTELATVLGEIGVRVFRCESPSELAALSEAEAPRIIVLSGQRGDFLLALAARTTLADVPLLCLSERFVDPSFEAAIASRPRTMICNSGPVFRELGAAMIRSAVAGRAFLPAPTGLIVVKAIFFLNRHARESVSRWTLSEQVNASEDYVSRIFHRQMGVPLWDYLSRLRIAKSVELLRSSTDSIAEIASRSGFQDQAYFCRVFRRVTGLTPGAFRKDRGREVGKVQ